MFRDVTERSRYEERLTEVNEQLEMLNRVVRHDIRNDMNIILGWAEMLEGNVGEEGREHLEYILASAEHVVELTTIAREYVETLSTDHEFDLNAISLRSILETELALRRESFPEAEFVTTSEIPDVEVTANEMLGSVFRNVLN